MSAYSDLIASFHPVAYVRCNGDAAGSNISQGIGPAATDDGDSAAHVDGTGYISVPTGLGEATGFTILAWLQLNLSDLSSSLDGSTLFNINHSTLYQPGFFFNADNAGNAFIWLSTSLNDAAKGLAGGANCARAFVADGRYHLHALTFDGTTSLFSWELDGVVRSTRYLTEGGPAGAVAHLGDGILDICGIRPTAGSAAGTAATQCCAAYIDEIAVFDYALTYQEKIAILSAADANAYPDPVLSTGPYPVAVLADRPVAYYRMNETAGVRMFDSSGHDAHGAYHQNPAVSFARDGLLLSDTDQSVLFDGLTNDGSTDAFSAFAITPIVPPFSISGAFSFEIWWYALDVGSGRPSIIVSNDASTSGIANGGVTLQRDSNDHVVVNMHTVTGNAGIGGPLLYSGTTYQFGVSYDGGLLILYVDGVPVGSAAITGAIGTGNGGGFLVGTQQVDASGNHVVNDYPHAVGDELSFYNYALSAARFAFHYAAGTTPLPGPVLPPPANNDAHYWQIAIYDRLGNLVDIPQVDVVKFEANDTLNGGSTTGSITLRRSIRNVGAVAYLYRVLIWVWNGRISRPLDPWYAGYIENVDTELLKTSGTVTLVLQGDAKLLDRAIVEENINPNDGNNGTLDAADYLKHLFSTYAPPNFGNIDIPPGMFFLEPMQFSKDKLGAAIDTVVKSGRDTVGLFYTWVVRVTADLSRTLVFALDQNPNVLGDVKFAHVFAGEQTASYKIETKYNEIVNVMLVEGGKDNVTGQTVRGVYENADSIAAFDAWEGAISVSTLRSSDACATYAQNYLDIHANPQAQGDLELLVPDPLYRAGLWIQIWESTVAIKQMRVASVKVTADAKTRIKMTLSPTAPTPYLDAAVYRVGLQTQGAITTSTVALPVNTQAIFTRLGGGVTAST